MASTPPALVNPGWLTGARWVGLAGLAGVAFGAGVGLAPGWSAGASIVAILVVAASNVWLVVRGERAKEVEVGAVLFGDTVLLSVWLYGSGGPSNPLTSVYLVPVVTAAALLRARYAWGLLALTVVEYSLLFLVPGGEHVHEGSMRGHLVGMVFAYALTGPILVVTIDGARRMKAASAAELVQARAATARAERLASLATLAAGAAHELATPLSTIFLVSGELARFARDEDTREDLALIRAEIGRCKRILDELSADAGAARGEGAAPIRLADLLQAAASAAGDHPLRVEAEPERVVVVPARLVGQVLRRLVGNARDASPPGGSIVVTGRAVGSDVVVSVRDQGRGMTAEELERATEPFFTTKAPGDGTGLGLFFASAVAHRLGGELTLDSAPGHGTTATLRLPAGAGE